MGYWERVRVGVRVGGEGDKRVMQRRFHCITRFHVLRVRGDAPFGPRCGGLVVEALQLQNSSISAIHYGVIEW